MKLLTAAVAGLLLQGSWAPLIEEVTRIQAEGQIEATQDEASPELEKAFQDLFGIESSETVAPNEAGIRDESGTELAPEVLPPRLDERELDWQRGVEVDPSLERSAGDPGGDVQGV